MLPVIGDIAPWEDPSIVSMRRMPAHVPLDGFRRRSLDGRWRLQLFTNPDQVPAKAVTGSIDDPALTPVTVAVPGNWTMQDTAATGIVDFPHYTNIQMPFPGPPPRLPNDNTTGVYRRNVVLPDGWLGQRIVLHVGGAESVHALYFNGRFVGYGTDSRLPSEYDVSAFARAGDNDVAIVVIRFSAQSYVEDQDQWWMAGLHRSVWIESRPNVHIADFPIDADFDPATGVATIDATAMVDFGDGPSKFEGEARTGLDERSAGSEPDGRWSVTFALSDPGGRPMGAVDTVDVDRDHDDPDRFVGFLARTSWEFADARPWSAESPARYAVTATLNSPSGKIVHTETQYVGCRRVEVRDRQLLVNGQPIWIFGVNRHDHHPRRGKAVTPTDIHDDLVAMRAHNITSVRTSHYPNDSVLYDLCDELGMYVVDEANLESHGNRFSLCNDDRFRQTWVERGARMVQRDRNHPSVIAWSLGNESGYGSNHDAEAAWIRRTDPSRPLHYEDAIRTQGWVHGGRQVTDIVCPMYSEIAEIEQYGINGKGDRPLILCEYSHAMGNSNGSLADYWDVITTTPGLQGGFIWEWKDHGLYQVADNGKRRLAYGGQFGDSPHDGNFVADGLMSADLVPHPALQEVKWVYRPVTMTLSSGQTKVLITNRRSFVGLDDLVAKWEILVDGETADSGTLDVGEVPPGREVAVPVPNALTRLLAGKRTSAVDFRVTWKNRRDTWFGGRDHVVAWDQVTLINVEDLRSPPAPRSGVGARANVKPLRIEPRLNLWRAPTDNDGFKLMPELNERLGVGGNALARWVEQGLDRVDPDEIVKHTMTTEDDGDGSVVFRHVVRVPKSLADLPRVGAMFALPARFRRVRYWGMGPHENYPDRYRSAMFGVWEHDIDALPYQVPQEFGLRTDCRWMELVDPKSKRRVRVDVVENSEDERYVLHMAALRYSPNELYTAADTTELAQSRSLWVYLDVAHRGIGTASCGPAVLPEYRIPHGRFEFAYRVTQL